MSPLILLEGIWGTAGKTPGFFGFVCNGPKINPPS